jgi:hypothetical protein
VCVAFGCVSGPVHAQSSLATIDRELSQLCGRAQVATGENSSTIKARLAGLWRQRSVYLANMPEARRTAELRTASASADCLAMARRAAVPVKRTALSSRKSHGMESVPPSGDRGFGHMEAARGGNVRLNDLSRPNTFTRDALSKNGNGGADKIKIPKANGTDPVPTVVPQPGSSGGARLEEFFPWPPPAPSGRTLFDLTQFGGGAPPAHWGAVADRLIAMMRKGQFPSWGFYAAPGGFAVIPRIEQLDETSGEALAGSARWATETRLASTSVLTGIFTTRRPKGLYRAIAFVLTTDARTGGEVTDAARMMQLARRWGVSGALDLPDDMRNQPVAANQRLFVLVYEFESALGGATTVNSPGRFELDRHLANAGLMTPP